MSNAPVFGVHNSSIHTTNDGRLTIVQQKTLPKTWKVIDTTDGHVEFTTNDRIAAEGIIAGYDYREYLDRD